jgi:molybdenum cofactor synthesis domain-containing protein
MRIAVLTISDAVSQGERVDTSGDAAAAWAGNRLVARAVVPDESDKITKYLIDWCDYDKADLVITTGGTGLAPRDITPEATMSVLQRMVPGISERIRMTTGQHIARAALGRGVSGQRANTLIINLPGSTNAVKESLAAVESILEHAVKIMRGQPTDHSSGGAAQ